MSSSTATIDFTHANWSNVGYCEGEGPSLENGDPIHWGLTENEKGLLAPFVESLPDGEREGLYRSVRQIYQERGAAAIEALSDMLDTMDEPLGLSPKAFSDESGFEETRDYVSDWISESLTAVGIHHFGG